MKFEEKKIQLKDGRTCTLKPNTSEYAQDMIDYLKKTSAETPFLLRNPDEVQYTLDGEKEILDRLYNDPNSVMMIAIVGGKVAGNSSINGMGDKRKIKHRCSMAIALYEEYWGLGIGSAMIEYLTSLAKEIGYSQMELEVVANNERAQALYKKCGFVEYGRRPNALKFDDGSYNDEILMYKAL
ncbi:GNAT family N-acetyltransferase [Butyrivibrio sp. VCB2006]|uniref:GNAT family N-acetyltransferase n=1 Tax=Butyrivibrio sp. VCB2006 TaxID=1280679 RepID=UPI00042A4ED5|nr:GNAT family N-acetyltransferase [Butyrivibrio sp. VCB2006]